MKNLKTRLLDYLDTHSSIIKLTVSADGIIRHANAFAEKLAGRDLILSHIRDFFSEINASPNLDKLLNKEVESLLLNVNTFTKLPQTYYFTTFKTDQGMVLVGEINMTEMEEIHKTIVTLNNDLSNLTRQLQKKNFQLDQLNQQKNQFLGIAAHDLRSPIASILMFSELVMESNDYAFSDELKEILEMINSSSHYMLKLLDELLDVVKIESGKLQLNYETINMEKLLQNTSNINRTLAAKSNIQIELNIPQALPHIPADPVKMEQVLNNLLSNAIKFSNPGTTITVDAFSTDTNILICVKDQGQGIPKDEQDKLFTPFANISVKAVGGERSTGLGLSIVKRIISGHMGRIWVESQEGKGSAFYFTLPRERAKPKNSKPQTEDDL